jgi:hypothetical protein
VGEVEKVKVVGGEAGSWGGWSDIAVREGGE